MDRPLALRLQRPLFARRRLRSGRPAAPLALPARLWRLRRFRQLTICLALALPCLAALWLWLRHSPLVAVERVQVRGVHGADARAIDAALTGAAMRMSTLDVKTAALRASVASYPQVQSVHAQASFPHTLRITVVEQLPVATLASGSLRTAVAANGVVLGSQLASSALPLINASALPGERVRDRQTREYLAVLGAAPAALRKLISRVYMTGKGITVQLHNGMLVYFGDATRPHAKWLSLATVVVARGAQATTYIDVRLPERPAAGAPGETSNQASAQGSGLEPNSAALAESLAAAVSGSSGQSAAAEKPAGAAETQGEAPSEAHTETTSTTSSSAETTH